ncbi:unnamed protein product, partial [Protopolystoma xenopodis]
MCPRCERVGEFGLIKWLRLSLRATWPDAAHSNPFNPLSPTPLPTHTHTYTHHWAGYARGQSAGLGQAGAGQMVWEDDASTIVSV